MRRILILSVLAGLGFLVVGLSSLSAATERIRHFRSYIVVHPDATMTVTETITVQSAGREIRRASSGISPPPIGTGWATA